MSPIHLRLNGREPSFNVKRVSLSALAKMTHSYDRAVEHGAGYFQLAERLDLIHGRGHYHGVLPYLDKSVVLWRARRMPARPNTVSEISYPAPELNRYRGRLNEIGESMFYAAFGGGTCLYESNAELGETFALSTWCLDRDLVLNYLGFASSMHEEMEGRRTFAFYQKPSTTDENVLHISNWHAQVFTRAVPQDQNEAYRASIALARWAMNHPRIDGVIYPSVKCSLLGDNIALKTSTVDGAVKLKDCFWGRIYTVAEENARSCSDDLAHQFEILGKATPSENDPTLHW